MHDRNSMQHSANTNDWKKEERHTQLLEEQRDAEMARAQKSPYLKPAPNNNSALSVQRPHREGIALDHARHDEHGLYAIIDTTTKQIVGGLQMHRNSASAIRQLADIARGDTIVNKHPLDFELRLLGTIDNNTYSISAELAETIITGDQIAAMLDNAQTKGN